MHRATPAGQGASSALVSGQKLRDHSFASLDLMRGLSALAVLIQHTDTLVSATGRNIIPFAFGSFAVDVFMLISGFLMMWHYYERSALGEKWTDPKTFGKFYLRRFFRIAPLYYFLILAAFPLFGFLQTLSRENAQALSPSVPYVSAPTWFTGGNVLAHLTFAFGFIPRVAVDSPMPDWSIGLEMQFYLFFPFLALLARRIGFGFFFFLCCLISAVSAFGMTYYEGVTPGPLGHYPQPSILPLKLHVFAVGMLAAEVFFRGRKVLLSWWYLPAFIAMALSFRNNYSYLLFAIYVGCYAALILPRAAVSFTRSIAWINRWCEGRAWLKWPAEFSYSAYLLHQIVFTLVFGGLNRFSGIFLTPLEFLGAFLLALVVVNSIGLLCFKFVEQPGIKLGRNIVRMFPAESRKPELSA